MRGTLGARLLSGTRLSRNLDSRGHSARLTGTRDTQSLSGTNTTRGCGTRLNRTLGASSHGRAWLSGSLADRRCRA